MSGSINKVDYSIVLIERKDIPSLKMATGNEAPNNPSWGANQLWLPGGKTNNGVTEAIFTVPPNTPCRDL